MSEFIEGLIRDIPDFPKPGVIYKDITPVLCDPRGLRESVHAMVEPFRDGVDVVVGIESRGFLFGAPIALELGVGLALVRKPGKLPAATTGRDYELEYGTDTLEIHKDALEHGARALVVDDLLATGGTASAVVDLIGDIGGKVAGITFLIELGSLPGRDRLAPVPVHSVIRYD